MDTVANGSRGRIHYAFIAGTSAAAASVFGKLTAEESQQLFVGTVAEHGWGLRAVFFGLMILCNAMVWTFFVKALHGSGGTLAATVCSAASNYCISALFGCLIFGETTSLLWWAGTALIIMGVVLISTDDSNRPVKDKTK